MESMTYLLPLLDNKNKNYNNIKLIMKPIESFYTYKYKDYWINNHESSQMELHKSTDWQLNMLWNEKVFLVNETVKNKYFTSLYYGWCDIGYFRNRNNDLHTSYLKKWPNPIKLSNTIFKDMKIHYGCVQNNITKYKELSNNINNHYINKLSSHPNNQFTETCFAGGFFILKPELSNIYAKMYDNKLQYYFSKNYFIKDDQSIIMDIIFSNPNLFYIHTEENKRFDIWFMFQRLLF
jgi:hypothetical protein